MADPLDPAIRRPGRGRVAAQVALAAGGVAVIAYFLHASDAASVGRALAELAAWIPLLVALEGARIAVEAAGTGSLYGLPRARLPWRLLLRSHVVGYGLAFYMPAGRVAAEAVKAVMLAPRATPARAAAVAAANQSLALLGLAIAAAVCALGAAAIRAPELVASLLAVAAVAGGLGAVVRIATLRMRGGRVQRFAPRIAALVDEARGEVPRRIPPLPSRRSSRAARSSSRGSRRSCTRSRATSRSRARSPPTASASSARRSAIWCPASSAPPTRRSRCRPGSSGSRPRRRSRSR